jgi:hypothetical protein
MLRGKSGGGGAEIHALRYSTMEVTIELDTLLVIDRSSDSRHRSRR